jgi:hypothetical protein
MKKAESEQNTEQGRCAVCGWPLGDEPAQCHRGDCSMRPLPERFYDPTRARTEYRGHLDNDPRTTPPKAESATMEEDAYSERDVAHWLSTIADLRATIARLTQERDSIRDGSFCTKCGWSGVPRPVLNRIVGWLCGNEACGYMVPTPKSAHIAQLQSALTAKDEQIGTLLAERYAAHDLLRRLLQWDHFDGAGDGPFWRAEIAKVLTAEKREPKP